MSMEMNYRIKWTRKPDYKNYTEIDSIAGIAIVRIHKTTCEYRWYPRRRDCPEGDWVVRRLSELEYRASVEDPIYLTQLQVLSEIKAKMHIIRCCYSINYKFLIPSELLFQADIRYKIPHAWVDDWTSSNNDPPVEGFVGNFPGSRPIGRHILLLKKPWPRGLIRGATAAPRIVHSEATLYEEPPHIHPQEPEPVWGLVPCDREWRDPCPWVHAHRGAGPARRRVQDRRHVTKLKSGQEAVKLHEKKKKRYLKVISLPG